MAGGVVFKRSRPDLTLIPQNRGPGLQCIQPDLCNRTLKYARIQRKKELYFWLDTLCIPVVKKSPTVEHNNQINDIRNYTEKKKNLKKVAISRMTPIYVGARRVLMLDSELLSTSCLTSVHEIRARIIKSAWMGRYWTMQESYLTRHLSIAMKDGFFNAKKKEGSSRISAVSSLEQELHESTVMDSVGNLGYRRTHEVKKGHKLSARDIQLMRVWNASLGRSTSQPEDVIHIYANSLDFDAQEILSLSDSPEERTKAVFSAQDTIPLALLFSRSSRIRSRNQLDRWVPNLPGDCRVDLYSNLGLAVMIAGQGLKIYQLGSNSAFVAFLLPAPNTRATKFRMMDAISGKGIGLWLHNTDTGPDFSNSNQSRLDNSFSPHVSSPHQSRLLILEREALFDRNLRDSGYVGCGAILCDAKIRESTASAVFDSALSFCQLSWIELDSSITRSPIVDVQPLREMDSILIETSKTSTIVVVSVS